MNAQLSKKQRWTIARLAYWYLDRGRPAAAEKLTRGLLALDVRDGAAWQYYGEARLRQNDAAEAARAFGEAAKLLEDRADVWMRYGEVLLRLHRFDEARGALSEARKRVDEGTALEKRVGALLGRCEL